MMPFQSTQMTPFEAGYPGASSSRLSPIFRDLEDHLGLSPAMPEHGLLGIPDAFTFPDSSLCTPPPTAPMDGADHDELRRGDRELRPSTLYGSSQYEKDPRNVSTRRF